MALAAAARVGPQGVVHPHLESLVHPHLESLVKATGENALLQVLRRDESLCIDKVESPMPIRVTYEIGRSGPLFAGTSGKVLLAFMPQGDREAYLARTRLVRYTETTIVDRRQLRRNLEQILTQGYVETFGELDDQVYGIGARSGKGLATSSAASPSSSPRRSGRRRRAAPALRLSSRRRRASATTSGIAARGPRP
jgi:DNA-binding IclR family transcriptional regulator